MERTYTLMFGVELSRLIQKCCVNDAERSLSNEWHKKYYCCNRTYGHCEWIFIHQLKTFIKRSKTIAVKSEGVYTDHQIINLKVEFPGLVKTRLACENVTGRLSLILLETICKTDLVFHRRVYHYVFLSKVLKNM